MRVIILKVDGRQASTQRKHELTMNQRIILRMLVEDKNLKEIAHHFKHRLEWVRIEMMRMRRKYQVRSTYALIRKYLSPEVYHVEAPGEPGDLIMNSWIRRAQRNNRSVELSPVLYDLMERLARSWGQGPVHEDLLFASVFGTRSRKDQRKALSTYVSNLKQKLIKINMTIDNVFGEGYFLKTVERRWRYKIRSSRRTSTATGRSRQSRTELRARI